MDKGRLMQFFAVKSPKIFGSSPFTSGACLPRQGLGSAVASGE